MNATTARQRKAERSESNRAYVRDELKDRQPGFWALLDAVAHAVSRDRVAGYPPVLRDHAFGRVLCRLIEDEPVLAARARGYAAESARDAFEAIRDGNLADARALLHAALSYLDLHDLRMVNAS
jgi:hypothetical protein